jgi:hypothetical protein
MSIEVASRIVNGHNVEVVDASQFVRKGGVGEGCFLCGRKVGKISYSIHMSVDGDLLPFGSGLNFGGDSQGCFQIGSECRKGLPRQFVTKE